jgi:peptide/nickel transport system permease protein
VRKHALRNAMLPITTLVALSLGYIVAGAILIETVFSWPGIGRAVYEAVLERDYPMLQGAFLLLTIAVVLCNLIADLLYFKLDPRITE